MRCLTISFLESGSRKYSPRYGTMRKSRSMPHMAAIRSAWSGTDGVELRLELALCGLDRDLRRPLLDTNDLDAAKDSAPAPPDLLHHGPRDGGIVGDAAGLDEDRALADDAGLALRQLPTVEPLGVEAVLDAASEQGAEPLELQIVC